MNFVQEQLKTKMKKYIRKISLNKNSRFVVIFLNNQKTVYTYEIVITLYQKKT